VDGGEVHDVSRMTWPPGDFLPSDSLPMHPGGDSMPLPTMSSRHEEKSIAQSWWLVRPRVSISSVGNRWEDHRTWTKSLSQSGPNHPASPSIRKPERNSDLSSAETSYSPTFSRSQK